jgi:hypothetical protein
MASRDLPSAYNAIYRSVLSYDLPEEHGLADHSHGRRPTSISSQRSSRPTSLELFFAVPEEGV